MGCSGHLTMLRKFAVTARNLTLFFCVLCAIALLGWIMIVLGDKQREK